jgi:hypothetical protein
MGAWLPGDRRSIGRNRLVNAAVSSRCQLAQQIVILPQPVPIGPEDGRLPSQDMCRLPTKQ